MQQLSLLLCLTWAALTSIRANDAASLPTEISPTDPNLHYVGRFDTSAGAPRCAWPNSAVKLVFNGTDINARLNEKIGPPWKNDQRREFWQIAIDGKPTNKIELQNGDHLYSIGAGLATGTHTVELVKATESMEGITQILGFQLNSGGNLLSVPPVKHRMEVIGDSISCGGNNEGTPKDPGGPAFSNAYFSYGAITARNIDADYVCIAWSGKTMAADHGMPAIYGRILPEGNSQWDYSKWLPDSIAINLSTNDMMSKMPDEAAWTDGYEKFIARLRSYYPDAQIYCMTSPMLYDSHGNKHTLSKSYISKVVDDLNAAGDKKVHLVDVAEMAFPDGVGGSWHPNVKTDQKMADTLTAAIKANF